MDSLNYKGKIDPDPGMIYGPDMHGARYEMVDHIYNPETDTTKAFFKPYLGDVLAK